MTNLKIILASLFKLALYCIAGLLMGNGFRAQDLGGALMAFAGLLIISRLERRLARNLERDRVETWLRHKGHSFVADRFNQEIR